MDHSLHARVRAGDRAAFGQLFDEYARVVYRHAARMSGDLTVAEDVVSLTFLEAWRLRERLRPGEDSLGPWLLGIATNVLRNTARAARRHRAAMSRLPPPQPAPDIAGEVAGRLDDRERLAAASAALRQLSRADREVVALCVWADLDYGAAAAALGVPVGTVRSRLSRARGRLRRLAEAALRRQGGSAERWQERAERRQEQEKAERRQEKQEPARPGGQLPVGRTTAARSTQEYIR
ncbi:RNA polymerase sigma factor [Planosporangium sp. 12N6]|uniref:RNA polymerase sigma factor n=1 Tax=Planosporangium spinosum TaxID=3402278 RepID=UPI003CE68D8C